MSKEEEVSPNRTCPQCGSPLGADWKACPHCGRSFVSEAPPSNEPPSFYEYDEYRDDRPSVVWYLLPFLLGFVGGLIAYIGTHDRSKDMATKLTLFGLIWSIVLGAINWYAWISALYH